MHHAHTHRHLRSAAGGALSLLLTLAVIGVLAYLALKSGVFSHEAATDRTEVNCVNRVSELVNRTHGVGPDYETGYAELPQDCRRMAPPPGAGGTLTPPSAPPMGTIPDTN